MTTPRCHRSSGSAAPGAGSARRRTRSAALRELQSGGNILGHARWLAAVSGGGYLAGADQMLELGHPEATLDQLAMFLVGDRTSPSHHRFLENDPGGLVHAVLYASLCVVANVVAIGVALFVVAWPFGWVFGTWAFRPDYRNLAAESQDWSSRLSVPTRLWLPGVVLVGIALVVLLLDAVFWRGTSRVARFSVPVLAAGLGVLTILVVLPWSLAAFQWLLRGARPRSSRQRRGARCVAHHDPRRALAGRPEATGQARAPARWRAPRSGRDPVRR